MNVFSKRLAGFFSIVLAIGLSSCDLNKLEYTEDDSESVQNEAVAGAYYQDAADLSGTAVATPSDTAKGKKKRLLVADARFNCSAVTLDVDDASTILHPIGKITVDFGTGCFDTGGSKRTGKIIVNYSGLRFLPGGLIVTTFENYTINGVAVTGTYTVTNLPGSTNKEPVLSFSLSGGMLTWPDGKTATRDSEITRTWIRTPNALTDQWYVTGEAGGMNRNGKTYSMEIKEQLVFQRVCQELHPKSIPSNGKEALIVGGKHIDIDFGDGSCDQQATITIKGKSKIIDLSKSME